MDAIFFPRQDYPVQVCTHRYGKSMAYTEQTDSQQNDGQYLSYQWLVPIAKQKGIKVGIFAMLNGSISSAGGLREDYDNGDVWLDAYSYVPNLAQKMAQGEVITEEEWNTAYNTYLFPNFYAFTGKKPVALSYSYGNHTFQNYITQFLAGRNSGESGNTDFGVGYGSPNNVPYSFSTFQSKESTTRWYDAELRKPTQDWDAAILAQGNLIDSTKLNGGWINNFTHWHNVVRDGRQSVYEDYLEMLAEKNAGGDIWFCGYGEAVAYLVYRQLITKAVMYSPNEHPSTQLFIRLEAQNTLGIDTDLLQVPISVKFSTVGTPLAGKTITSDCNLVSLGNGDYIIEIPYTGRFPYAIINEVNP